MLTPTIAHVVSSLQTGGAEKFVVNLALAQQHAGLSVAVFSYGQRDDPLLTALEASGVDLQFADDHGRWQWAQALGQADVVHIHSPAVIRALAPVFFLLRRRQVVYTIHGEVDPPQSLLRFTHQIARFFLHATTAVSKSAQQSVDGRYGWSPTQVQVVTNGITLPESPLPRSHNDILRLGCVSRLITLKNIPLLFEAIQQLPPHQQRQLDVTIVGDGPEREHIAASAAATPELAVTFTGNLSDEVDIYSRFDVLVNCSDTEGLPMTIIEAMGYGRSVIATAVGAVPSAVLEGETGWLYPPKNPQYLAAILEHLLADTTLIDRAGDAARDRALTHYSITAVAARFDAIYGLQSDN